MYTLLRGRSFKSLTIDTLPPLFAAFIVAEMFYKWKSFTLECLGFLVTWFVFDFVRAKVAEWLRVSEPQ